MPTWVATLLGILLIIILLPFFLGGAVAVQAINPNLWILIIGLVIGLPAVFYIRRNYPQPWMWGLPNTGTPKNNHLESPPNLAEEKASIEAETKKCPMCAETIKLEALKCRFCGHLFDENEIKERVEKRNAEINKKLDKGLKQCPTCGKWDVYLASTGWSNWVDWCPHCTKLLQEMKGEI